MGSDSMKGGERSDADGREDALEFDAVVVGSGFGGAVTACRLTQAGLRVAIVERGRRYEKGDFPNLPAADALAPDFRRWTWRHDQGLWDVVDLEEVVSVQAAGYGGGSLVYANVHLRPPAAVFDDQWPELYRNPATLEGYFDLAASMLEVAPVTAYPEFQERIVKADQLKRAAGALHREPDFFYPPLAIRYETGTNDHGVAQAGCKSCGSCCSGCPHTAKSTLDFNYLAIAERRGARVFTQCEVVHLEPSEPSRWWVDAYDHLQARRLRFRAKYVFLCAGAIHTTRLLARAKKLPATADKARKLAGVGYFPGGDALGVVYDTKYPQHPSSGPTITTTTVKWKDSGAGSFFMIQDGGYAVELDRLIGIFRSSAWLDRNRLSDTGPASVAKTTATPADIVPAVVGGFLPLPSLVDAVLDAVKAGDLRAVAGPNDRKAFGHLVNLLKGPLLLTDVVRATMEGDLRDKTDRSWLLRCLPKWCTRAYTDIVGLSARVTFGTHARLADFALKALTSAAGLPRARVAERLLGYDAKDGVRRAMLLAMGRDAAKGVLHYDEQEDRMIADLDLYALAPGYAQEEGLMTDMARALGGELRTNPAWAFLGKPVTVHNQGGCRMSDDPDDGVTTEFGEVRGCDGLFVADGSLLCTSVGVNPSATIAAIAEHNVHAFIRKVRSHEWPEGDTSDGAREYGEQRERARAWAEKAKREKWAITPPYAQGAELRAIESQPLGIEFDEVMDGYYAETDKQPVLDGEFRKLETLGRPSFPVRLKLHVDVDDLAAFFEDDDHRMALSGEVVLRLPGGARPETCAVREGTLRLFVPRSKSYAIDEADTIRREAQRKIAGKYRPTRRRASRDEERRLDYDVSFSDASGLPWRLLGFKRVRDDPAIDAWRDTSSLFVTLCEGAGAAAPPVVRGAGVAHVEMTAFLFDQVPSVQAKRCDRKRGVSGVVTTVGKIDPAREAWAVAAFSAFFFGSLQRIYVPEVKTALDSLFHARRHVPPPPPPRTAPRP